MSSLLFSLNCTMPVFLTMMAGFLFRKLKWMDEAFASKINSLVFKILLPVMLFLQIGGTDFKDSWDGGFVLYCFLVTFASIFLAFLLSFLFKSVPERGEFIQAAYRSSASILGMAYIGNIYGDSAMGPLMMIGAVPVYNVMAVFILMATSEEALSASSRGGVMKKTLVGVIKNPIILGILFGMVWSLLGVPMPQILHKTLSNIAQTATPMGLLAMGASIDPKKVSGELLPSILASFMKLVGLELLFLPLAVHLGFRTQKLVAILVMLGSPTTVTSFVMAKSMGHEGTLTSNTVVITTFLSAFTLTFWVFLVKTMGLI
ncbi:MAG: AEC family transporter [Lachnospiraceae bacterium]|nr:AEC family transporter [Lachnospiraceae bacterium]